MVAAGASFSAGLTDKGSVIAWGNLRVFLLSGALVFYFIKFLLLFIALF